MKRSHDLFRLWLLSWLGCKAFPKGAGEFLLLSSRLEYATSTSGLPIRLTRRNTSEQTHIGTSRIAKDLGTNRILDTLSSILILLQFADTLSYVDSLASVSVRERQRFARSTTKAAPLPRSHRSLLVYFSRRRSRPSAVRMPTGTGCEEGKEAQVCLRCSLRCAQR